MNLVSTPSLGIRSLVGGLIAAAPMLLLGLFILLFAEPWIVRLAYASVVAIVVVVGLQVYVGNAGGVNFAHTIFVAIGAYSAAILSTPVKMKTIVIPNAPFGLAHVSVDPAIAALVGLGVVAIFALITGLLVVRLSGTAADIFTLCLQIIAHGIFITWNELFKGSQAFFGIPQVMSLPGALLVATAVIIIARMFRDSPIGVQLRASSENLMAARCFGVNVKRLRLLAWVLSALICGIGGMLFAFFIGTISAKSFYFSYVFLTLAMLILGGMRTVSGAIVGVLIVEIGIELIRNLENGPTVFGLQLPTLFGLSGLALGVVIVTCMVFRPNGIMGTRELDEWLLESRSVKKDFRT
jgi:branched-chain amino acid transport system permease protein